MSICVAVVTYGIEPEQEQMLLPNLQVVLRIHVAAYV